ncbi:hypothetical protein HNR55_002886 [Acetobacter lovaniensis]|uniref:Uncharacterized protein n=1 Tax=Acetobacter lovaniensis TaxID=104100 RepID=A0A841QGT0_9PROT|nr:hypothetical protein [Acetobacter lovaniensis]
MMNFSGSEVHILQMYSWGVRPFIGRSRDRLTTKPHAIVDAISLPLRIHPTPG